MTSIKGLQKIIPTWCWTMANEDRKIVPPTEVHFGDNAPKPDSIDDTVQAVPALPKDMAIKEWNATPTAFENLHYLGRQSLKFLTNVHTKPSGTGGSVMTLDGLDAAIQIIPLTIYLNCCNAYWAHVNLHTISFELFKRTVEQMYGSDIVKSGVYEQLADLYPQSAISGISAESMLLYFPELRVIRKLDQKNIWITKDPYMHILSLPMDVRAFFTGATRLIEPRLDPADFEDHSDSFTTTLTTKEIIDYAKQVGQLHNASTYLAQYK